MFGRDKTQTPQTTPSTAAAAAPERVKAGGKGRATPSRREAEARNRRPVVGAPPPPKAATRAERKAQRAARSAAARQERAINRQGMLSGDERFLPARDKGPARRFVRDHVDARYNLGEFFLPVALASVLIGLMNLPVARLLSLLALYLMVLAIIVDGYLLNRRLKRLVRAKFGDKHVQGVGMYGVMRGMQLRRARMPKPMVARREYPK